MHGRVTAGVATGTAWPVAVGPKVDGMVMVAVAVSVVMRDFSVMVLFMVWVRFPVAVLHLNFGLQTSFRRRFVEDEQP